MVCKIFNCPVVRVILPLLLILTLGVYCSEGIFSRYFFSTHDADHHLARSFDAVQALKEGHFPLRWAGSLNFFCGAAIFNFFYPLLYYLIAAFNFFTKDVITALKIVYALSFTVAPAFFYFWLKEEVDNVWAGLTGAILYLFVPYRFLLIFVRSSPEFLAYTVLPIYLYFHSRFFTAIKKNNRTAAIWGFLVALTGAALIISHNLAAFLLAPVLVIWFLIKIVRGKVWEKRSFFIIITVFAAISIIGLSAFFWGPVLLEKKQVKLGTLGTIHYWQHYPTLKQLIRSKWEYFYSAPGTEHDHMSFSLGYAQWLVLGLFSVWLLLSFYRTKSKKILQQYPTALFWFLVSVLAIFLMLKQSRFFWSLAPVLQEIQFPWRILGITSFTIASLAGFWLKQTGKTTTVILALLIIFLAIYGNRNHLLSQPLNKEWWYYDFEANHPHRHTTTTYGDDIINRRAKRACSPSDYFLQINDTPIGHFSQRGYTWGTVQFYWSQAVKKDIKLNLEYFDEIYQIKFNKQFLSDKLKNQRGRLVLSSVPMKVGKNTIHWQITQSPIQTTFNKISLTFLAGWLVYFFAYVIKKAV